MSKVTIKVQDVDGVWHEFQMDHDREISIVDLAEEHGVELPYSCRSGACFTCCAGVNKGKKYLEQNKTGEQLIDVEPEEFLCCIGGVKPEAFEGDQDVDIEMVMLN
ncbi:MAG: 2Fe-2S iron-sulfur cluster binding domain-containing protein [Candidatus Peribacteria bacterium]|nr:MAG: 2Fe-2S iron-sulfur cluster binding domain-containing protein [Candidatus Peribacteria bacterium]